MAVPPPPPPPPPVRPGAAPSRASSPPPPAAPPPAKGRSPIFWMLAGCGGCLVVVILFVAGLGGSVFYLTRGPVDAVRSQLADLRAGRLDAAYERCSASYRARVSREDFAALVSRHPALAKNADSTFTSRSIENDTARISGSLTGSGGEKEPVAYGLVKEGGGWKIASIRFEMGEGEKL